MSKNLYPGSEKAYYIRVISIFMLYIYNTFGRETAQKLHFNASNNHYGERAMRSGSKNFSCLNFIILIVTAR
ncbi:hypothetical protein RIVM261_075540 [Rivularia sp. IAM M-261]|nr:hypothetical protein RIVM261_075540 [Rivularia sp. IAM M-261]